MSPAGLYIGEALFGNSFWGSAAPRGRDSRRQTALLVACGEIMLTERGTFFGYGLVNES